MRKRELSKMDIERFRENLIQEEKSSATVEKYFRDAHAFNFSWRVSLSQKKRYWNISRGLLKRGMLYAALIPCWHLSITYLVF